jgi:WD40 repeat protein
VTRGRCCASELVRLPSGECHELAGTFSRRPAVSPEGGLVYGGSDATTRGLLLSDTETGLPVDRLDVDGHQPPFSAPAFSPSGRLLADSGRDAIQVWDVASGRVVARFTPPGMRPWSLDISADETLLAFGCDARPVHVVSLPSGQPLHVLTGHTRRLISAVAFASDSTLLASSDGHDTRLWNAHTGEPVAVARVGAQSLAFSADGRHLAAGGHGLAWIIDVARLRSTTRRA